YFSIMEVTSAGPVADFTLRGGAQQNSRRTEASLCDGKSRVSIRNLDFFQVTEVAENAGKWPIHGRFPGSGRNAPKVGRDFAGRILAREFKPKQCSNLRS